MIRASRILAQGAAHHACADTIVVDSTDRRRRRATYQGVRGLSFLLDLPEVVALRSGDAIMLDDGRLVEVLGKPEPLAEVRVRDPRQLAHIAWHLGNRHLAVQIFDTKIRFLRDHVIEDMVRGLGGKIALIEAPFEPEGGAYQTHSSSHSFQSASSHAPHSHGHSDSHAHSHTHEHGHGEGCDGGDHHGH